MPKKNEINYSDNQKLSMIDFCMSGISKLVIGKGLKRINMKDKSNR